MDLQCATAFAPSTDRITISAPVLMKSSRKWPPDQTIQSHCKTAGGHPVSALVDLKLTLEQIACAAVVQFDDAIHFDLAVAALEFVTQDGRIGLPSPAHHGVELSLRHDQVRGVTTFVPDPGVIGKHGPEVNNFSRWVHLARGKCEGMAGVSCTVGIQPEEIGIGIPGVSVNNFLRHGCGPSREDMGSYADGIVLSTDDRCESTPYFADPAETAIAVRGANPSTADNP